MNGEPMPEKKQGIQYYAIRLLALWAFTTLLAYPAFRFGDISNFCLLNSMCFSSNSSPLTEAILFGLSVCVLVFSVYLGFYIALVLLNKFPPIILGGWVLVGLGFFGIAVLILVTPGSKILEFIHIIVIGLFLSSFGAYMLIRTAIEKPARKRRRKKKHNNK